MCRGLSEVGFEAVEVSAKNVRTEGVVYELTIAHRPDKTSGFKLFHVMRECSGADPDELAHRGTGW